MCVCARLVGAIRQKLNMRTFTQWNASKAGIVTQNDVQDKESAVEMCVLHELGPTQLELHTCRAVMTSKPVFSLPGTIVMRLFVTPVYCIVIY